MIKINFKITFDEQIIIGENADDASISLKLNQWLEKKLEKILLNGYGHMIDGNNLSFFFSLLFLIELLYKKNMLLEVQHSNN